VDCGAFIPDPGVIVEPRGSTGGDPRTGDVGERMEEDSVYASDKQEDGEDVDDEAQRLRD
jgi:hypothetical protein